MEVPNLDWEIGAWTALRRFVRWMVPEAPPSAAAVPLEAVERRLGVLASLVAGAPLRVTASTEAGGLRGQELLLPPRLDVARDPELNRGLYVLRVVVAATGWRLHLGERSRPADEAGRLRHELHGVVLAVARARDDLPAFGEAWDDACALCLGVRPDLATLRGLPHLTELARRAVLRGGPVPPLPPSGHGRARGASPPVPLWGAWLPSSAVDATDAAARPRRRAGHEAPAVAADELQRVRLDEARSNEHTLQHNFEKVETIEPYTGQARKLDGTDELADELEALQEAGVGQLVRGGPEPESVLRAEVGAADVADAADARADGIPYDEWDHRARVFRKGWCTVHAARWTERAPAVTAEAVGRLRPTIDRLRCDLEVTLAERRPRGRQLDGDDVDVDACVDAHALRAAGRDDPRVYVRQPRVARDLAVLALLDISLSADGWVGGRRVLDVSREAVLVLGEVTAALGDAFAVHAFASATRHRCEVWEVKGFSERWVTARDRVGALEPRGYTRIGAALRHATALLAARPEKHKLLLLFSDGRPTDHDRYEGAYGIADVRMAVRQAVDAQVHVHALALDARASAGLPALFGPGGWELLPTPERLPEAAGDVFRRWRR